MFSRSSDDLAFVFHEPLESILDDLLRDCQNNNNNNSDINNNNINNNNSSVGNKIDAAPNKVSKKRQRKSAASSKEAVVDFEDAHASSDVSKKVMHREIERQRRHEMASLYASLRSLLPLEYVKGKRSISDHMHQAVNYIKDMQKKIEEMQRKRETLKRSYNKGASSDLGSYLHEGRESTKSVKVSPCLIGFEILIICNNNCLSSNDEVFPISKVLVELIQRRLNVVSCTSSRSNDKLVHKIEIEADDFTCIDPFELQEKLVNVINLA